MLKCILVVGAMLACAGAARAQAIDPALYVVRDADSTMYLYGTVHVRPAGADWGDAEVRAALAETQEIWTEIEISPAVEARGQALARRYGMAPPGKTLSSSLSADENARLQALTRRLGIPASALEPMQPWLAGLTLTIVPIMQAGFSPTSGVDRFVDGYGDQHGKTMRALETVEDQLGFLANLSPELQRQMLREAIDEAADGPAMLAEMTRAWDRGDDDALARLVVDDTRVSYPELYDVLFVRRNNAWMETLTQELAGAGVDFVAVGGGHIVGEDGLVAQFRARGFSVERVR
ncbi:lipoprotein [alpha proteobacterium U9-1i]|nr:lipoprotein [alpha proteobacterium U9-1i]